MLHDVKHENEQKLEIELHQANNKRELKGIWNSTDHVYEQGEEGEIKG